MQLRTALSLALLILIAVGAGLGCRDPLVPDGSRLLDASGREILLRGVNARVEGLFDVTFDDGRIALESIPPFTGEDCRFLARELGLNFLRLPVNWSGIEPEPGQYDETYLDRIADLVASCGFHGVHTLVDLHQDAWSKEIGEDGAPLWAIIPPPQVLLEGPLGDLDARRFSSQVLMATNSFFENVNGLQDAYAAMLVHLARRLRGLPTMVGIELMNEPLPAGPDAYTQVWDFNVKSAEALRAAVPEVTVFFEPVAIRNTFDAALETSLIGLPFPVSDAVYTPHVYTGVFSTLPGTLENLRLSIFNAVDEGAVFETPVVVSEWGNDPKTEDGRRYLRDALGVFDEARVSWAVWLYEEWSQGSWGLYDEEPGPSRGALREDAADVLARPFPQAVDGRLEAIDYDADLRKLRVDISEAGHGLHRISTPRRVYPDGVRATCDGRPVRAWGAWRGRIHLRCSGHRIDVRPAS